MSRKKSRKSVTLFPGNRCSDKWSKGKEQGNQDVLVVTPLLINYFEEVTMQLTTTIAKTLVMATALIMLAAPAMAGQGNGPGNCTGTDDGNQNGSRNGDGTGDCLDNTFALDKFLETTKFGDMKPCLLDVQVFILQQRDLTVTFDTGQRIDDDPLQVFRVVSSFQL